MYTSPISRHPMTFQHWRFELYVTRSFYCWGDKWLATNVNVRVGYKTKASDKILVTYRCLQFAKLACDFLVNCREHRIMLLSSIILRMLYHSYCLMLFLLQTQIHRASAPGNSLSDTVLKFWLTLFTSYPNWYRWVCMYICTCTNVYCTPGIYIQGRL